MYENLSDEEFVELLFTSQDQLGPDYIERAKARRITLVPLLCDLLADERNYQFEDKRLWAVIHAVYILGIVADPQAIDTLIQANELADDYEIQRIADTLPECYFRIGPDAIPGLQTHIDENEEKDDLALFSLSAGLWNLWAGYPDTREDIEDFFLRVIQKPGCDFSFRTHLITDFAQINREDLKPMFEDYFEKGEVNLDILSRDDLDYFFNDVNGLPGFRTDLEAFYSEEENERRRPEWREDEELAEQEEIEEFILDNYNRIGRNERCPCGSGKKFKKCHLAWAEEERRRLQDLDELLEFRGAIMIEREVESALRRLLAVKNQQRLFDGLKDKAMEAIKAPMKEFQFRGLLSYIAPVFSQIEFDDEEDTKLFLDLFMDYFNALAWQYQDSPKDGEPIH
jgi:hypothetical protein